MDWSPILAELPKAVPYTIGTLIGGLIAVATQFFTHRLSRRREREQFLRDKAHEREQFLRDKAEELLHLLYQHMDWVRDKGLAMLEQADHVTPSPLDRAHAIQYLHFSQLEKHFIAINEALNSCLPILFPLSPRPHGLIVEIPARRRKIYAEVKDEWETLYRAYLETVASAIVAVRAETMS